MTEKRLFVGKKKCEDRFTIINDYDDEIGVKENRSGDVLVLKHSDLNAQQFVAQLVVFLNDQNQAIVDLYDGSKFWSDKATERIKELEEENKQLKSALKELKEIGDYQADRIQELNEENTGLHIQNDFLKDENQHMRDLVNENNQLKSALKELREIGDYQADRIQELNDENEKLKKMIFEFNEKAKRFINNPNDRPIRTNEDYWVGVNNITSFLMEMIE